MALKSLQCKRVTGTLWYANSRLCFLCELQERRTSQRFILSVNANRIHCNFFFFIFCQSHSMIAFSEVQIWSCHVSDVMVESPPVSFLYSTGRKDQCKLFLHSLWPAFALTVKRTEQRRVQTWSRETWAWCSANNWKLQLASALSKRCKIQLKLEVGGKRREKSICLRALHVISGSFNAALYSGRW